LMILLHRSFHKPILSRAGRRQTRQCLDHSCESHLEAPDYERVAQTCLLGLRFFLARMRRKHGFAITDWVFQPDHWHAIIYPTYPLTISTVFKAVKGSSMIGINVRRRQRGGALARPMFRPRPADGERTQRNGGTHPPEPRADGGVICVKLRSPTAVIPAKAGIQSAGNSFPGAWAVDSRFRGNDCACRPEAASNDATPPVHRGLVGGTRDWKLSSVHECAGVSGERSVSPPVIRSGH
jgi:hypothetical protein